MIGCPEMSVMNYHSTAYCPRTAKISHDDLTMQALVWLLRGPVHSDAVSHFICKFKMTSEI